MKSAVNVAITGAAGQIGYALAFRVAAGALLGPGTRASLQLLEITPALGARRVGAGPTGVGMARRDLLLANARIFSVQGRALNEVADRNVKVLVVGNPANTNALIARSNARDLNPRNFTAMTRLDHNRALSQLAHKTETHVSEVRRMIIWGNHSATQNPDLRHAEVAGKPAKSLDRKSTRLNSSHQ